MIAHAAAVVFLACMAVGVALEVLAALVAMSPEPGALAAEIHDPAPVRRAVLVAALGSASIGALAVLGALP